LIVGEEGISKPLQGFFVFAVTAVLFVVWLLPDSGCFCKLELCASALFMIVGVQTAFIL
jgi:hypothetical protein